MPKLGYARISTQGELIESGAGDARLLTHSISGFYKLGIFFYPDQTARIQLWAHDVALSFSPTDLILKVYDGATLHYDGPIVSTVRVEYRGTPYIDPHCQRVAMSDGVNYYETSQIALLNQSPDWTAEFYLHQRSGYFEASKVEIWHVGATAPLDTLPCCPHTLTELYFPSSTDYGVNWYGLSGQERAFRWYQPPFGASAHTVTFSELAPVYTPEGVEILSSEFLNGFFHNFAPVYATSSIGSGGLPHNRPLDTSFLYLEEDDNPGSPQMSTDISGLLPDTLKRDLIAPGVHGIYRKQTWGLSVFGTYDYVGYPSEPTPPMGAYLTCYVDIDDYWSGFVPGDSRIALDMATTCPV